MTAKSSHPQRKAADLLLLLFLWGCGDSVEGNIALLAEGGDAAEEAKMELIWPRGTATVPLIAAFQTPSDEPHIRVDLADALFRLYLRETDPRILEALTGGLSDSAAPVRAFLARGLGDLRRRDSAGPLVGLLSEEQDNDVRLEILLALEGLGIDEEWHSTTVRTDKMTAEEHAQFTEGLVELDRQSLPGPLRRKPLEWLEILAEEKALEA